MHVKQKLLSSTTKDEDQTTFNAALLRSVEETSILHLLINGRFVHIYNRLQDAPVSAGCTSWLPPCWPRPPQHHSHRQSLQPPAAPRAGRIQLGTNAPGRLAMTNNVDSNMPPLGQNPSLLERAVPHLPVGFRVTLAQYCMSDD